VVGGKIVLLSGPICSGKSTLAEGLIDRYKATLFKTHELIRTLKPKVPNERGALQRAGDTLDRTTEGRWIQEALARLIDGMPGKSVVIIDAVRITSQVDGVREAFPTSVYHVHLTASGEVLARRFASRNSQFADVGSYDLARANRTERNVERLADIADIVVKTDQCTADDVLIRAVAQLGLYPRTVTRIVDVLVGGQYGSEGKGNVVAHIAPEYQYLMRVGGPNAGHKVFADPIQTFHHLPSGTTRCDAKLLIGPGAVLRVPRLLDEIAQFGVRHDRLSIDPSAMIINDSDVKRERERLGSIGSTAQGVGEATARRINDRGQVDKNRKPRVKLAKDIRELKPFVRETAAILEFAYLRNEKVLLEGTQGTSLSLYHGSYPHVTSRDTTVSGCLAEAGISPTRVRRVVMVCRTYPIRVGGTSGPMSQEITMEEIARRADLPIDEVKTTEITSTTHRPRRIGEFDWGQLRRSTILNGPTDIALTFVDYLDARNQKALRFEQLTLETLRFIEEVERVSGVPVTLISTRFHWRNIIDRRSW
jgi:adenylosuccinate synthase